LPWPVERPDRRFGALTVRLYMGMTFSLGDCPSAWRIV